MTLNQYIIFEVYKKPEEHNISIGELVKTVAVMSNYLDCSGK